MSEISVKPRQFFNTVIEINFYISAILLVSAGVLSLSDEYSFFTFNETLYGAIDNSLRMMMIYLALSELVLVSYCVILNKGQLMLFVGTFLILMVGSLRFYSEINDIEIDPTFPVFFLYTGISHIAFGVIANIEKNTASKSNHPFK